MRVGLSLRSPRRPPSREAPPRPPTAHGTWPGSPLGATSGCSSGRRPASDGACRRPGTKEDGGRGLPSALPPRPAPRACRPGVRAPARGWVGPAPSAPLPGRPRSLPPGPRPQLYPGRAGDGPRNQVLVPRPTSCDPCLLSFVWKISIIIVLSDGGRPCRGSPPRPASIKVPPEPCPPPASASAARVLGALCTPPRSCTSFERLSRCVRLSPARRLFPPPGIVLLYSPP